MKKGSDSMIPNQPLFELLRDQVIQIHLRWAVFEALFYTTQDRINLIRHGTGTFFEQLFYLLLDDVALGIARLTDPPKQSQRDNLVLEQLILNAKLDKNDPLFTQWKSVKTSTEPIRMRRNRVLAHSDLRTYLTPEQTDFIGLSIESIKKALHEIREYMNLYEIHSQHSSTAYQSIIIVSVEHLFTQLVKATEYDYAVEERLIPHDRISQRLNTISKDDPEWFAPGRHE